MIRLFCDGISTLKPLSNYVLRTRDDNRNKLLKTDLRDPCDSS